MSLEENWLQYFQTLHTNEPPSPDKKFAMRRKTMNVMANTLVPCISRLLKTNTGHGNFDIGRFHTHELEMDYPSKTGLCTVPSPPHRQPFSDFFTGEWAALHRLSETDNPSPNCRRIVHSKLKLFHFEIKTYYLPDANNQTDNPSHTNNPSLVWKRPFLL